MSSQIAKLLLIWSSSPLSTLNSILDLTFTSILSSNFIGLFLLSLCLAPPLLVDIFGLHLHPVLVDIQPLPSSFS